MSCLQLIPCGRGCRAECWDTGELLAARGHDLLAGLAGQLVDGSLVVYSGLVSDGKAETFSLVSLAELRDRDPTRVWPAVSAGVEEQLFLDTEAIWRGPCVVRPLACCSRAVGESFDLDYTVLETAVTFAGCSVQIRPLQWRYNLSAETSLFVPRHCQSSVADDLQTVFKNLLHRIGQKGAKTLKMKRHISSFQAFPKVLLMTALRSGHLSLAETRGKSSIVIKPPWKQLSGDAGILRGKYKGGRGFTLGKSQELVLDNKTSRLAARSDQAVPDGNLTKRVEKRKQPAPRTTLGQYGQTAQKTAEQSTEKSKKQKKRPPRTKLGIYKDRLN